jgi:hypothetical protein
MRERRRTATTSVVEVDAATPAAPTSDADDHCSIYPSACLSCSELREPLVVCPPQVCMRRASLFLAASASWAQLAANSAEAMLPIFNLGNRALVRIDE